MVFDITIREKTTGSIINLRNVSREHLDKTFKDRIKQLWLNEKIATDLNPKRKVSKKVKPFKEPKI
jgi:hypothetical protein